MVDNNSATFAYELSQTDIPRVNPKIPPNSDKVIVWVMPNRLDEADELAAEYDLERVYDEMDRRHYKPT